MRKKLLFILLLLVPFLVNAKHVEYEWEKSNNREILFYQEKDGKYLVFEKSNSGDKIVTYESTGRKVSSRYLEDNVEDWALYTDLQNKQYDSNWFYILKDGKQYE